MFEKIRKMKNKKGFTLVELIVVLVILAILAALLVPALTGYIDKANDEKITATTRQIVMAAQTTVSEAYGKAGGAKLTAGTNVDIKSTDAVGDIKPCDIAVLAEVATKNDSGAYELKNITSATVSWNDAGHVTSVVVVQSGRQCTYDESTGTYTVVAAGSTESGT